MFFNILNILKEKHIYQIWFVKEIEVNPLNI